MLRLSPFQKGILVFLFLLLVFTWLGFNWVKYVCSLGLIFISILTLLIKIENDKRSSLNFNVFILITAYFCFSKLQPVTSEKIDTIFWGLFVLEFLAQFLGIKKFKQPIVLEPFSIKFYNLFQILLFSVLMIFPWSEVYKWLFIIVGVICNIDHLLIIYWLPYYTPKVNNAYQAFLLKKEYQKIYGK